MELWKSYAFTASLSRCRFRLHRLSVNKPFSTSCNTEIHCWGTSQTRKMRCKWGFRDYSHKAKSNLKGTRNFLFSVVFITQCEYCNEVIKVPCVCSIVFTISLSPSLRLELTLRYKEKSERKEKMLALYQYPNCPPPPCLMQMEDFTKRVCFFRIHHRRKNTPSGCLICV